jgi:hypothetical protein
LLPDGVLSAVDAVLMLDGVLLDGIAVELPARLALLAGLLTVLGIAQAPRLRATAATPATIEPLIESLLLGIQVLAGNRKGRPRVPP